MTLFVRTALLAAVLVASCAAVAQPSTRPSTEAEARAMLQRLVAFRSVAGSEEVARMADYLAGEFIAAGFAEADIERIGAPAAPGLLVRYRPRAGAVLPPILFLAHMDVVDARPSEWASDPWTLTERDGALHGRGVVDNKFGLLTLSQAFIRLKREGHVPDRELVLAFSGDEETVMQSTQALARAMKGAAFAINSDAGGGYRGKTGTTYAYQAAEKTYATFELTARNPGGHSSRPRADNAIYALATALQALAAHRFPVRWNAVTLGSFRSLLPTLPVELRAPLSRFVEAPGEATGAAVLQAEPGFVGELRTTCVATMLRGGIVENALPTDATATVNCRIFPGETVAEVQAVLAGLAGTELQVTVLLTPLESPVSEMPAEAKAALDAVLAVRAPGASAAPYMEAGSTDGMQFRRAGIPTIGIGPLFGTDASNYNYHGIDERLPLAEFRDGLDHYYLFIKALQPPRGE